MTRVFVADLSCLACGRGRQLVVNNLLEFPRLPERCSHCAGSVMATSTTVQTVRAEPIVTWPAAHRGRPLKSS